jgi:hypothetical protein
MRLIKIVLTVLAVIIIIVLFFGWYIGFFNPVKVEEKQAGGYLVVGTDVTGPYSKVGKSIMEVDDKLKKTGITSTQAFGIYYDDPDLVPAEKCRSFVGDIVEEKDRTRFDDLKAAGFRIDSVPLAPTAIAEFPMKNSMSYMVGPMKIYPILSKHMKENGFKVSLSMEIYDNVNGKIIFMMQH